MAKRAGRLRQVGSRGRYSSPVAKPVGFAGVRMNPASCDNAEPRKLDTGSGENIRYLMLCKRIAGHTLMDLSTEEISTYDPRTADASPRTAEFSDRSRAIAGASPKANVQAIVKLHSCGERRFYWYTFFERHLSVPRPAGFIESTPKNYWWIC